MKSRTFAVGIALLVIFASAMVYYAESSHPLNLKLSSFSGPVGYNQENFTVDTSHGSASYIMIKDSNSTSISVGSYESGFGNLTSLMILYIYKTSQNVKNPYTDVSFQISNASMAMKDGNNTTENIPVTIGRVGQNQVIKNYDFQNPLTVVKSKSFITLIVRPAPAYISPFRHEAVGFNLSLTLSKIAEIGLLPVSSGNQGVNYSLNFTIT